MSTYNAAEAALDDIANMDHAEDCPTWAPSLEGCRCAMAHIPTLRAALAELDEWKNSAKFVADETRLHDEKHCGCVAYLRVERDRLREACLQVDDKGNLLHVRLALSKVEGRMVAMATEDWIVAEIKAALNRGR